MQALAGLQTRCDSSKMGEDGMKVSQKERRKRARASEITLTVERDEVSGWFVASWDAPHDEGGITTQGKDLRELEQNVREAVACHFDNGKRPKRIRLHFVSDPVLVSV